MKWLLENFWLKIAAFAMGLLVWFHVATEKTYVYELKLPLTEISLKESLTLTRQPVDSLRVSVSATGKQLLRRSWRKDGLRLNAAGYQAGRYTLPLSTSILSLAHQTSDLSLEEIFAPATIQLEIDFEDTTEVTITADLQAEADEGFAVRSDPKTVPAKAILIGPRSKLGLFGSVLTEQKKLAGLRDDVTLKLPLVVPPGYGYSIFPDSVTVTVQVVPVRTRLFDDLPLFVFNAPPEATVTVVPSSVTVELTGPPGEIEQLDANAVSASVDFANLTSTNRAAVRIDCPPRFLVKYVSADSVQVEIQ